jgi:hypothetical protein
METESAGIAPWHRELSSRNNKEQLLVGVTENECSRGDHASSDGFV